MSALEEKKMITRAELIKMLSDVDTDGSGTIEFGEFVEMITSKVGNRPYGDVVARLSSRTVVMGNQTVGQSTKHYKAKLKKASVTEQALSCAVTLQPSLSYLQNVHLQLPPNCGWRLRDTLMLARFLDNLLEEVFDF